MLKVHAFLSAVFSEHQIHKPNVKNANSLVLRDSTHVISILTNQLSKIDSLRKTNQKCLWSLFSKNSDDLFLIPACEKGVQLPQKDGFQNGRYLRYGYPLG
ncbi:hypothetical protein L596_006360 [Steinernema carpocapsae]|uniref:Uncharacterized protein n=1 Tax=Steinernema carpocapsae TaxID=34508 RepID=A0A4U8V3X0_STECR|nr:hypothetical protein L596_006360 [Steinernema carpocapsae]